MVFSDNNSVRVRASDNRPTIVLGVLVKTRGLCKELIVSKNGQKRRV